MKIDDKEITKVENEIKQIFGSPDKIVYDGVYDIERYLSSEKRIMWVLKESYGPKGSGGYRLFDDEDWNDPIANRDKILRHMNGNRTLKRIAQISFAVEHGFDVKRAREYTLKPEEYVKTLRAIGYVNTGKLIGENVRTSNSRLRKLYERGGDLVMKQQLALYKPQIIVFAGTFNVYNQKNRFSPQGKTIYKLCDCGWGDPVIVRAYHPAAPVNQVDYYRSILCAAGVKDN